MVAMKALVGFADRDLAAPHNPSGSIAAKAEFNAPSEAVAKRLVADGLAERGKSQPVKPLATEPQA